MQLKERTVAYRWKVLAVVSTAVFMSSLDLFIVNIAFPDIQRDFADSSLASLSWILNAYAIVFAALLVPAGRSADRLGRRRSFIAGLALFTAAFPVSLALAPPESPPGERRTAVAVGAAVGGVAAAAGPPVGGLLVQAGWQLVFLVNVPIGIALLFIAARVLRETREDAGAPRPDLLGALLAARSLRHPVPVVEPELLRRRSFALANAAALLFFTAFGAMLLSSVLFLTEVWGHSVLRSGLEIAPGPAMAAAFAVPAGVLAQRYGERIVGATGALLFALSGV